MQGIFKRFLFLLIACLFVTGISAQEDASPQVNIVGQPAFDQQTGLVQVDVMVHDAQGFPISDLALENFDLGDAVTGTRLTPHADKPLTLAIIVDTSAGSSINLIQDTLLAYFEHYHQPQDNVTFYIVNFDPVALRRFSEAAVASLDDAVSAVNALQGGETYYFVQPALEAALNDLTAQDADPLHPRQALFVGSFLNSPREAALATAFAEAGIPLHVVQVHRTHQAATGAYRALAENGGGLFANNQDGVLVLDETHEPVNLLKVLFDAINNSRLIYTLTFQPGNVNADHQQTLALSVDLPGGSRAEASVQYTLELLPPAVTFAQTENFDIMLEPTVSTAGALVFENSYQPVTLQVTYPDNVVRSLRTATVTVTNAANGDILQVLQVMNPQPTEDGVITFDWMLTPLQKLADMRLQFAAVVTDQTGLIGTAVHQGSITIAPVDQLVASIAAGEPQTVEPAQTSLLNIPFVSEPVLLGANVVLVMVVLLLLAFVLVRRRASPVAAVSSGGDIILPSQPPDEPLEDEPAAADVSPVNADDEQAEPECYGQLMVRDGSNEIGLQHALVNTARFLIGRSSECDLTIEQPYISPQHCLITFHDNRFFVRDLGSKNGTYVNGERIRQENVEVDVPLGSEISITRNIVLEIRGVDYEFMLSGDEVSGSTAHSTIIRDEVEFKRLPGLRYASDQGPAIDDEYSPI